jgi:sensor histidine kinase YesM
MNPTIISAAVPLRSRLHGWLRHRELRVFLIHLGIWLALDMVQYYLTTTVIQPGSSLAASASEITSRFRNDTWGYLQYSLWTDIPFLLLVHLNYGLFRVLFRRESLWRWVVFLSMQLLLFFLLAVGFGIIHGYFHLSLKAEIGIGSVFFVWAYALLFVTIRAYRQNRRERKQADRDRAEAEEQYRRDLEKTRQEAQIAALKAQVNPHFLFNTLNNLYGTALTGDTDRTAAGIEQLSGVMRHIVEETNRDRTPIAKEIRFLEDTVALHRMRLPQQSNIRIDTELRWDEADTPDGRPAEIAPLLLGSFVENAFKYGISLAAPCFVEIGLTVERGTLRFRCRNSMLPHNRLEISTGTGIDNIRQRLALLYPGSHELHIDNDGRVFSVDLTIQL